MQMNWGMMKKLFTLLIVFSWCGCNPVSASPKTSGKDSAQGSASFHSLSMDGKIQLMQKEVTPTMREIFADSPNQGEKLSCRTCHGSGAKNGTFKMPSPDLPSLNDEIIQSHPLMSRFMKEKVTPAMAKLLGDPQFHCTGCHISQ